jgi:hypothetical protein
VVIPRRVAFLGLAALVLAVAGIAAAATYEDGDDIPLAIEQPATTTSSVVADTTTTVAVTSTTATPAPTTTTVARTTTTRRGATTTTRAGATTTTTAPIGPCTTAQIEAAVTTDKASYAQGEQVKIHSTLRNRSTTTCTYPSFIFSATILSPGGATITGFSRQGDGGAVGAGQANEASVNWDRLGCAPQPCPSAPGTYSVEVTWNFPGGPYTATRTFNLA